MSDFQKMAEEAKRASDERTAQLRAKEKALLDENETSFRSYVTTLRSLVMELLEEAVQACKQSGVTAHLQTNFDTPANKYQVPPARIEFWCSGQGGLISGRGYEAPKSDQATFEFGKDGGFMRFDRSTERLELTNDPRGAVATALEKILKSYFRSVERIDALSRS